ncbi:MAG: FkbM family methyltransferase [Bacteroidales bacterium]|nr:FkbM family methyltransferase [Bacteroidales bacterium]
MLAPRLKAAGHDVAIAAFHGLQSGVITWNDMRIYPSGFEPYGKDVLIPHAQHWFAGEPGLILTLIDAWVLPADAMKDHLCASWTPVDASPVPPRVEDALKKSGSHPIAMSKYGLKALQDAGFDPFYAPHAIDMGQFCPGDRDAARQKFSCTDNFVVGMVAANQDSIHTSRKGWPIAFQAFGEFVKNHDDALLMCHTELFGRANGTNLPKLAEACGISTEHVAFSDPYLYRIGAYPPEYLTMLYNAFDVFLNPALGEGFGIPILEAQACGCPVIVTDCTAMTELSGPGWLVDGEKVWTTQAAWWKMPHVSAVVDALEEAYEQAANKREAAREFALQYDADLVFEKNWKPILTELEPPPLINPADVIDIRQARHAHTWAKTGLYNRDMSISVPCTDPDCSAEGILKDGQRTIVKDGFSISINGIDLDIEDDPNGAVAKIVCREIERDYSLDFDLVPGDTVVDVGAHVGIVSIYLAKKYPGVKVLALEPVPENYARLCRNVEANGVSDSITTIPMAVTGDGRDVTLSGDLSQNSGGVSIFGSGCNAYSVKSTSLCGLFKAQGIDRVALLKIDCEGSEYEILTPDVLAKVDRIRGEFHRVPDHVPEDLLATVRGTVADTRVSVCG